LCDTEDKLSLKDLGFEGVTSIMVIYKGNEDRKRIIYLDSENRLTDDARDAYTHVYQMFSTDNKMTREQYANLLKECTSN